MDVFQIIELLSKKDKDEIEYALTSLMLKDKIDFINVLNAYVKALKHRSDDRLHQLIEAETCVMEGFINNIGGKTDADQNATQRCLYLLNQSKSFNMQSLNKKFKYDEEVGKRMAK